MQINGPTLKALREACGLSQVALAGSTGGVVSQGRLSEIESGGPVSVRPATAKALAKALCVPVVAITVPAEEPAA